MPMLGQILDKDKMAVFFLLPNITIGVHANKCRESDAKSRIAIKIQQEFCLGTAAYGKGQWCPKLKNPFGYYRINSSAQPQIVLNIYT